MSSEAWSQTLPALLQKVNGLNYDYAGGDGIDFEPYTQFLSKEETGNWIRAWTGNSEIGGEQFRIFGQDGTGGLAAFWSQRSTDDLLNQPVVFLGSEGEVGVVARNFGEYFLLLTSGVDPREAIVDGPSMCKSGDPFASVATEYGGSQNLSPEEMLKLADEEFPQFESWIDSLCRREKAYPCFVRLTHNRQLSHSLRSLGRSTCGEDMNHVLVLGDLAS